MNPSRFRPSPALVISMIALFVALGGVGYAAATVGTDDIQTGAVTSPKIHNEAVNTQKIATGAVGPGKIATGAVQNPKIANLAVTTGKLGDDSVTSPKLVGTTEGVNTTSITAGPSVATNVTATCPVAGQQALSGGYTTPDTGVVQVIGMARASDNSWTIRFLNNNVAAQTVSARVTCLIG